MQQVNLIKYSNMVEAELCANAHLLEKPSLSDVSSDHKTDAVRTKLTTAIWSTWWLPDNRPASLTLFVI